MQRQSFSYFDRWSTASPADLLQVSLRSAHFGTPGCTLPAHFVQLCTLPAYVGAYFVHTSCTPYAYFGHTSCTLPAHGVCIRTLHTDSAYGVCVRTPYAASVCSLRMQSPLVNLTENSVCRARMQTPYAVSVCKQPYAESVCKLRMEYTHTNSVWVCFVRFGCL